MLYLKVERNQQRLMKSIAVAQDRKDFSMLERKAFLALESKKSKRLIHDHFDEGNDRILTNEEIEVKNFEKIFTIQENKNKDQTIILFIFATYHPILSLYIQSGKRMCCSDDCRCETEAAPPI